MGEEERRPVVVVGCDGSWESGKAVVVATREAARRECDLVLLSVADERLVEEATLGGVAAAEREVMVDARVIVDRAAGVALSTDPSVAVEVCTPLGTESPELAELADRAALLVLGGHGSHGQVAFSLGSVSAEISRVLGCPVLVPRRDRWSVPSTGRSPSVVVGIVNGTVRSSPDVALAAYAVGEARRRVSPLVVVTVSPAAHASEEGALREAWENAWEMMRAVPGAEDLAVRVVVAHEDPATTLITETNADDLLIVGTRGGGTLAGLVSGSVAREVLDALPCDVVVLPPAAVTSTRLTPDRGPARGVVGPSPTSESSRVAV